MCIHLNLMIFTKIIRGFISATLAVTVPDSVEIVTYMELEDSSEAVQSSSYNAKK
uniref:htdV n=1 Tax=Escherichia coli TaxID=562 RepID=UPI001F37DEDD|nr:htdV [Escherichia coli]